MPEKSGKMKKMVIKGLNSFLFFSGSDGKMFASTLFPINSSFLIPIRFSISIHSDEPERKESSRFVEEKVRTIFTPIQEKKVKIRSELLVRMGGAPPSSIGKKTFFDL